MLSIFAYFRKNPDEQTSRLLTTLQKCLDGLSDRPRVEKVICNIAEFDDLLERLGAEERDRLARLWNSHPIQQEPIIASDGEIRAEPLFWFQGKSCKRWPDLSRQPFRPRPDIKQPKNLLLRQPQARRRAVLLQQLAEQLALPFQHFGDTS